MSAFLGRSLSFPLLLGFLLLGLSVAPAPAQAQDRQVVDRIVAVVGDNIILKSEVDYAVRQQTQRQNVSYSSDLWMDGLKQLVDQQLLAEKARRDTTITISDQQLTTQLNRQIEQLTRQAGSEAQLEQRYGKSIPEIKETFRENLRGQLLAQKLRQRRMQNINITPSEVRQWFERIPQDSLPRLPNTVRLSHIVRYPKPTPDARQEAKSLISSIRDSIVSGEASFGEMARTYSDDDPTASGGGSLGQVNMDRLVPEFAAVAARVPVGQISQVFYNESRNGFHILRVKSRSENSVDLDHILIQAPTSEDRTRDYLNAVRDTLLNYEDVTFELMAKRHSEEERTATNGGRVTDPQSGSRDLALDALGPSWKRTIENLEEGEISKPARVQLLNTGEEAFHIVLLDRRTPAHRVNLETDYSRIRRFALQDKRNRKMQEWLDQLRDEIYVDIRVSKADLAAMRRR